MKKASRRTFIKQGTITVIAAPLISTSVTRALAQAAERKISFALCGLGGLSTNQIAPALQKTAHCRLAGIISGTPAKIERWKAQYNIPDRNVYNYDTMSKLADNPDIDVVYVVTPNGLHAGHTIKAAKAGKHVLCEKPMEVSAAKCQEMIDACKAAKRMLAIGYRCRFEPNHLECVKLANEKTFGALKSIEARFDIMLGDPNQWRLRRALAGGGALMDVGIYALQATRYLTGEEPVQVSGSETKTDPVKFKEVDETLAWEEQFPSGVTAKCHTSYNSPVQGSFNVVAEKGSFGLDPAFFYNGVRGRRSDDKEISLRAGDQFAAEMDNFARCILDGKPTRVPGEEGLRDVKIMMAIYESVKAGKPVKLS
jgi:predicted dehydrogenase